MRPSIGEDCEVARKSAKTLPDDPERRRGIRYSGHYVVWWDDGRWEWLRCVNCGTPLTSRASRERGYGAACADVVTQAAIDAILRDERANAEAYLEEKRCPARRPRRTPKRTVLDLEGFTTTHLLPGPRSVDQPSARRPRGMTNEQAKELARLQRAAGEPYSGNGMTEREARAEIQRLTG